MRALHAGSILCLHVPCNKKAGESKSLKLRMVLTLHKSKLTHSNTSVCLQGWCVFPAHAKWDVLTFKFVNTEIFPSGRTSVHMDAMHQVMLQGKREDGGQKEGAVALGWCLGHEALSRGHCRVAELQCCDSSLARGPQAPGTAQAAQKLQLCPGNRMPALQGGG